MSKFLTSLPRTRKEARARHAVHYYTGVPCQAGHDAPRETHDGECLECSRNYRDNRVADGIDRPYTYRGDTHPAGTQVVPNGQPYQKVDVDEVLRVTRGAGEVLPHFEVDDA